MRKILLTIAFVLMSLSFSFGQHNQQLADKINKMYELDQSVQTDIMTAAQNGASKEKLDELYKIKSDTFKNHIPILKQIIAENSFPTYDLVGKMAGDNFFTMIQHSDADLQFQKDCLKIIEKQVKKKQANACSFAYLTDRVNINSGKPQIYGTQLDYKNDQAVSKNLKDPKNVNKRRIKLGLEPLEDYLKKATEFHQQMNKKN
ncbi:MAG TPA: hypothetical protein PKY82_06345 [Pyrinomonadaceae bacterium]|nr:hypothetical protein [Pyrinomonadaceae bacterium]